MEINLRIKEVRTLKGMNMKEFASVINIDNSQYSKIEHGKLKPTILQLKEISSNFNISLNWLVLGEGNRDIINEDNQYKIPDSTDNDASEPSFEYDSIHIYLEKQIKDLEDQIKTLKEMLNEKKDIIKEKDAIIKEKNEIIEAIKTERSK